MKKKTRMNDWIARRAAKKKGEQYKKERGKRRGNDGGKIVRI